MDPIFIIGGIIAILVIVVGPGSGLYIAHRSGIRLLKKELNGGLEDIAAIRETVSTDHDVLIRLAEHVERHAGEISSLRKSRHSHGNILSANTLRIDMLEKDQEKTG